MLTQKLSNTTFLVIDLETSGLDPANDDVLEVAAVVVPPRGKPHVALESLVRPMRRVRGTEFHGITDSLVADAPEFGALIPSLESLAANRVVAGHNAQFDMRFLAERFADYDRQFAPPFVCTMGMMDVLGLGARWSLGHACGHFNLEHHAEHSAAGDAMAAALLLQRLVKGLRSKGIETFAQLQGAAEWTRSLERDPIPAPPTLISTASTTTRPRATGGRSARRTALAEYRDLVLRVLADLVVDEQELALVRQTRTDSGLSEPEWRAVHAQVFAAMINRYVEDRGIDANEASHFRRLHRCLSSLGWAPGD